LPASVKTDQCCVSSDVGLCYPLLAGVVVLPGHSRISHLERGNEYAEH